MKAIQHGLCAAIAGAALLLAACSGQQASTPAASGSTAPPSSSAAAVPSASAPGSAAALDVAFTPPPESAIPDDAFGAMVRKGRDIFTHTKANAGEYVGNELSCSNCHLDAGRRADSAPLWGAWGMYPAYRAKNDEVNSFAERLQGCFQFSMNGKAPPLDSEVIAALSTYAYWMAKGAPTGEKLAGAGYPRLQEPPQAPDYARGKAVYEKDCALCHGDDGQGQRAAGVTVFPPLWGPQSFNWGAGMHRVNDAAAFIKANMPFSRGGTLDDQDAWDVAYYMDAHERPQDPRFTGDVLATRRKYPDHDNKWSLYGIEVNGHLLGSGTPAGKR